MQHSSSPAPGSTRLIAGIPSPSNSSPVAMSLTISMGGVAPILFTHFRDTLFSQFRAMITHPCHSPMPQPLPGHKESHLHRPLVSSSSSTSKLAPEAHRDKDETALVKSKAMFKEWRKHSAYVRSRLGVSSEYSGWTSQAGISLPGAKDTSCL